MGLLDLLEKLYYIITSILFPIPARRKDVSTLVKGQIYCVNLL
jgi:hypothetical protein